MWWIGLTLVGLIILYGSVKRQVFLSPPVEEGEERIFRQIATMQELNPIAYEGYKGGTREEAEAIEEEREAVLSLLMKRQEEEERVLAFVKRYEAFSSAKQEGFDQWRWVQEEIRQVIARHAPFFNQTSFYPPDLLFDINRMTQKAEDAREFQLEDPLHPPNDIRQFVKGFEERLATFKRLHEEIATLLPQLKTYESTLKGSEQGNYLAEKQALFSLLQQGNYEEVESSLKRFRQLL